MNQNAHRERATTKLIKLFTSFVLLLGICLSVEAKKLREAECKPRPTVVAVSSDYNLVPYHVVLYRCSGTYENSSPTLKVCAKLEEHEVHVDVVDIHGRHSKEILKNHTKCGSECNLRCGVGQLQDHDCRCKCLEPGSCSGPGTLPTAKPVVKSERKAPIPVPYLIGMVLVGFFAIVVLVFAIMLYVKQKKNSCCENSHSIPSCDPNVDDNQKKGSKCTVV